MLVEKPPTPIIKRPVDGDAAWDRPVSGPAPIDHVAVICQLNELLSHREHLAGGRAIAQGAPELRINHQNFL